jgi:hypothetical protein
MCKRRLGFAPVFDDKFYMLQKRGKSIVQEAIFARESRNKELK